MLNGDEFVHLVVGAVSDLRTHGLNMEQKDAIVVPPNEPLMIVAGPGSGKTTVLALRALRYVFVDGIPPEDILVTTFTRKAATELRSRLVQWGREILEADDSVFPESVNISEFREKCSRIDVNRFISGTIDSIAQMAVTQYRDPGDPAPAVIDDYVSSALLLRYGVFGNSAHNDAAFKQFLAAMEGSGDSPHNVAEVLRKTRPLVDRLVQDLVDFEKYKNESAEEGAALLCEVAHSYWERIRSEQRLDYALLEYDFYHRVRAGRLHRLTDGVQAILIDEYQDTNPLQEALYLELCRKSDATLTVVGDDDQSLYRFRGATVELFRDFSTRFAQACPQWPSVRRVDLYRNYRSSKPIVDFVNYFVTLDGRFQDARVQPTKPPILAENHSVENIPILGMFRSNKDELAQDLSDFLIDVFRSGGRTIEAQDGATYTISGTETGDLGDAAFLAHTVNEYKRPWGDKPPDERLPYKLRAELENKGGGVFNPRGRSLREIEDVQILLGLILCCLDPEMPSGPNGRVLTSMAPGAGGLRAEAFRYLVKFRGVAMEFVSRNPEPSQPHTLGEFVSAWAERRPQGARDWPDDVPVLDLLFKLICWMPSLYDDPEGQVYLEAVARMVAESASFSGFGARVLFRSQNPELEDASIRDVIRNILAPIAENQVQVDEDIMPSIPHSLLPMMTIHQAKGLEYPLVVVDVASDFTMNSKQNRFRRFPDESSGVTICEDALAKYTPAGSARMERAAIDRTFDDLMRLYYVAYSRPQCVLLLVGINKAITKKTTIKHVGLGWSRDNNWVWNRSGSSGHGVFADLPFVQI